jgi:hypothetical protein
MERQNIWLETSLKENSQAYKEQHKHFTDKSSLLSLAQEEAVNKGIF